MVKKFLFLFVLIIIATTGFASDSLKTGNIPSSKDYFSKISPFVVFQAHMNFGDIKYDYFFDDHKKYRSYLQQYNTKGFSIGTGLQVKSLQLTLSGGYLSYHYWNAEHYVSSYVTHGAEIDTYTNVDFNQHVLPRKMFFAQANLEYNFRISRTLVLSPYVTYQLWEFTENSFYPIKKNKTLSYEIKDRYAYGAGGSLKGVITDHAIVFMKFGWLTNNFNPEGYFESLDKENFHKSHEVVEISFGYHYKF